MEEIFETLRKQIKGGFDQNNIIIILDNSISLTCKKHPIPGTNNSIFIIQPYLIDTIEKIGIQSINMYEQYQIIAVYQNQIPYLDLLIQVQWIKISLNLKWYFTGMFIQQKLSKLNEDIVRHETITGKPLTKEYIRFFNEPKKQYELTIKNYLQDIPNQLYDYLEQIELFPFQGYSTTHQELEYNYNYHIRYRTQRLKIQNQIEQESQQLIKNLILSNQINQITPTQIKIQF